MNQELPESDIPSRVCDLGNELLEAGYVSESAALFKMATDLCPIEARYWFNLARALREEKQYDAALEAIEEALKLDSSRPHIFHAKGNIKRSQKDWQGAIAEFRQALALDSTYPAYNNLGLTLNDADELIEAKTVLEEGLRLFPNDVDLHENISSVYFNLGDIDSALQHDQFLIENAPTNLKAWLHLAEDLMLLGRYQESLSAVETFIRLNGPSPEADEIIQRVRAIGMLDATLPSDAE